MSYQDVMKMPVRAFWHLNACVPRLQAEEDMRSLSVASCAQSSEAVTQIRENLVIEMGEVVKFDPILSAVRDETGFHELKALM